MSHRYLRSVSLVMIVVAAIGLGGLYVLRGGLPAVPSYNWPEEVDGKHLDEAGQRAAVEALRTKVSGGSRFLAGASATRRFDRARPGEKLDFDSSYDSRQFFASAQLHATVAIVMLWILLGAGVLGLLRLKKRGLVALGGSVLVLALLGGGAMLMFTGAEVIGGILIAIMLLGFFAQLVAANLMPDANHPFVLHAETALRSLPPERRAAHIAKRIIAGIAMLVLGAVLTVAAVAMGAGRVVIVPTGLLAVGLMSIATPLIASLRIRVAPHR